MPVITEVTDWCVPVVTEDTDWCVCVILRTLTDVCVSLPGYDNNFFSLSVSDEFSTCPSGKTSCPCQILKITILIKICDMFVKWILKGRKCDKRSK